MEIICKTDPLEAASAAVMVRWAGQGLDDEIDSELGG